jgi:hypothetical protein
MAAYILTSKNLRPQYVPVYAPVRVTLDGVDPFNKYVLQIFEFDEATFTYGDKIADIRQSPNNDNRAIIDLQNILQSFVGTDKDLESQPRLETSEASTYTIGIKVGQEDPNGEVDIDTTYEPYELVPTRLPYYGDINNIALNAQPDVTGDDEGAFNCSQVESIGELLTDMPTYLAGKFPGGRPSSISSTEAIHRVTLTDTDWMTVSYLNEVRKAIPIPEPEVLGAEGWVFHEFDGNSDEGTTFIANTIANGGGPNTAVGDGNDIEFPYTYESIQTSLQNNLFQPQQTTTHYFVYAVAYQPSGCSTHPQFNEPLYTPVRVDIVEPKCLDYNHIQVSWMNSYGFRDYYTFTKKNEKTVNISRNTYFKEPLNYNGTSLETYTYDRGETVYSQKIDEIYTATTDFMDDATAQYLQNLFMSPDTRVRFGDSANWFPVTITSNSYTERTYQKDKLFQYEISFRMAHPLKSQRG